MANQSEFILAINQIASERNIQPDQVITSVCEAIESNYQDLLGYTDNIEVMFDEEQGKIVAYAEKEVVDIAEDEAHEIPLIKAIIIDRAAKIGDFVKTDVSLDGDFGRIAAQSVRQVLSQKVRKIEKDTMISEFTDKIGQIESAIIQRADKYKVVVEIRKTLAIMPEDEKIPNEFYKSGARIKVVIKEIEEKGDNKTLIVSRAAPEFLKALFILEVPEIESESITIKAIAREAGARSKVAVYSNVDTLDPLGSCIGQKGVRINAIMDELKTSKGDEKVDVILWDSKIENFVSNALSPAQTIKCQYYQAGVDWNMAENMRDKYLVSNPEADLGHNDYIIDGFKITKNEEYSNQYAIEPNTAMVIVPDEQLSLAIGREGQNVRLAAKLTGVRIDVQGETEKVNTNQNIKIEDNQEVKNDEEDEE